MTLAIIICSLAAFVGGTFFGVWFTGRVIGKMLRRESPATQREAARILRSWKKSPPPASPWIATDSEGKPMRPPMRLTR